MIYDTNHVEADLTALFAAHGESGCYNALFQQTVHDAVHLALSGGSADEVFARMLDIPDAHPGTPAACRLILNTFRQEHSRELRCKPIVATMTAVRRAATATVAWVAGLNSDGASFAFDGDIWLFASPARGTDRLTPGFYWAYCGLLAGVAVAQDVADGNGGDVADFDPNIYDGADRAFGALKDYLVNDVDMMHNLRTHARQLADWVKDEPGFRELTEALIEKPHLTSREAEDLLTTNGLDANSLRFYHRSSPHVEIGLEAAMMLPADDSSLVVRVSRAQADLDEVFLQPLGTPLRC